MTSLDFATVFHQATGNPPYDYQCRLACGPGASLGSPESLQGGTMSASQLIDIPTGLGKTAAVVLAWVWNRVFLPGAASSGAWPRRLVYCLPMRTLVEQTVGEVKKWLGALVDAAAAGKISFSGEALARLQWLHAHSPVILMGGEDAGEWDIHPEREAILIGTQDMLLSRALNRGYGASRARWPMHFGLLNNDALWVLDETQLMGVGVRTSAQLEGLREKLGTVIGCATWWASATLDARLLETPDHRALPGKLSLKKSDHLDPEVERRVQAVKRLAALPFTLESDAGKAVQPYVEKLAAEVLAQHQKDTTTIVILNRVDRAQDLFSALEKLAKKQAVPPRLLVHSRFRPMERELLSAAIKASGEKIIVATQAIEAGVDISARTLITELAPWSSLVQRFGRCNRKGEFNAVGGADIYWINLQATDDKTAASLALPYTPEQLAQAHEVLQQQVGEAGVSPSALGQIAVVEPLPDSHLLRRKDLVELFDTTPDLAGLDIDVGRYIRDGEDRDVQVYWRELGGEVPADKIVPLREELVRVPVPAFKKFVAADKSKKGAWLWNVLDGMWQLLRPDRIAPGQVYLLDAALGGYSVALGWTGEKGKEAFPIRSVADQPTKVTPKDGQDRDPESQVGGAGEGEEESGWQTIEEHTRQVVGASQHLVSVLEDAAPWSEILLMAARWHDVGKAHACFQAFMIAGRTPPAGLAGQLLAKAPWRTGIRHERPHFRHELASALAWLAAGHASDREFENLVAYLIATHHGKIRLSVRAMPGEQVPAALPESPDITPLFARGVWQGDKIPADGGSRIRIEGFPESPIAMDLSCVQMGEQNGRPSWSARMLSLRDAAHLGLFRLAWLETLLRSADARGSVV